MKITESVEQIYENADSVESAFYRAFSTGDIELMKSVFADEGVSYTHSDSSSIVGREAVLDYWEFLLGGINKTIIKYEVLNRISGSQMEIHLISEIFSLEGESGKVSETITTNFYTKQTNGWRLQMQHSSSAKIIESRIHTMPNFMNMQEAYG